ncbi:MAG TPA: ABC transporter permease [Gaiellaceae bacterium]|nr:ABC transporter permease [Gaiellaceae bacterium]
MSATDHAAAAAANEIPLVRRGPWRQALARFRRRPSGILALFVVALFTAVGVFAGTLAPYQAGQEFLQFIQNPQPPLTAHHLLGTDVLSRDLLTQLIYAIHQTMFSALVCAGVATVVGVSVGSLAGYYGSWFDALVTWATGIAVSIPAMAVLVIVLIWSKLPATPVNAGLWLSAVLWTGVARVVRASVLSLRSREYIEAAQASGASSIRVLVRHLLPNSAGPIIVAASSLAGQAIVIIATVDYLGWSYNTPERPTLGGLIADATQSTHLLTGDVALARVWWLYVFPAALLVVLLMSFAFLGDALDEALNPSAL